MEEAVGKIWHRAITRAARSGYPAAAVSLSDVSHMASILFRGLGGDSGVTIVPAIPKKQMMNRNILQWVAGSGQKVVHAACDNEHLHLPPVIDYFPTRDLNTDLYLWLVAVAASGAVFAADWFQSNQAITQRVLAQYPGMRPRYARLRDAHLASRGDIKLLSSDIKQQELAIRKALRMPGTVHQLPPASRPPMPVPLWLYPAPMQPAASPSPVPDSDQPNNSQVRKKAQTVQRHRAERVEMPDNKGGLIFNRMETIFSWAEYIKVNRATEEDDEPDNAGAARDLDFLSLARDQQSVASALRFDLDLPPAAYDDTPIGSGILHPEWHWKKKTYQAGYCRIQPMIAADAPPAELPRHLVKTARRIRAQFRYLKSTRIWKNGQAEGTELDLTACIDHIADGLNGHLDAERGLYRDMRNDARDMACLLLADLSLSTDAWINDDSRTIDVIRDSLYLFSEALGAVGDQFGIFGFSSRRRDHVRFHVLKDFSERYSDRVRGRLKQIRPGYYTRMGAAIRQSISVLNQQPAAQRLLLIVTDGKPNDLDRYEGRYGIEDTRMAILEAKQSGIQPFCVTIDEQAGDYLPHLFGTGNYVVIRRAADLPKELPLLYARLTR